MESVLTTRRIVSYVVLILVSINLILALGRIYSDYLERSLLSSTLSGEEITEEVADRNDSRQGVLALASLPFYLAEFVAFLIWVNRTNRSLHLLDVDGMEYTPGWAAGWFLIPIANLFKPFQVMQEIWKGSNPETTNAARREWHYTEGSTLIGFWWMFSIASIVASRLHDFFASFPRSVGEMLRANTMAIISEVLGVGTSVLALYLVISIERRMQRKWEIYSQVDHPLEEDTLEGSAV